MYNFLTLITLFFLFLSFFIFTLGDKLNLISFLTLTLIVSVIFFFFRKKRFTILSKLQSELEAKEEKINILSESISEKRKILQSLPSLRQRISFLFDVSQNLIEVIEVGDFFDSLINTLKNLFPQADSILLFDFDKDKDHLSLVRSLKQKGVVVKEKRGDALDKWVLYHNHSLLVDDIVKDFRFDYTKIEAYKERGAYAFMVSPLSIGDKLLGLARIESKQPMSFSFDDSRLLRNICDLGAVVLERASLFEKLQDLAIKDSLTSLYVRDYFLKRLKEELKRALDRRKELGIIMLDIDDFKKINDTYGHMVGDLVLTKLAKILISVVGGAANVISRFGGEEFIILIVECNKKELISSAEKIRTNVEQAKLNFRRKSIDFTISLGAVLYPEDGQDELTLINKVDSLLYTAKRKGKNRLCFSGE